jgi:hypothetical protein
MSILFPSLILPAMLATVVSSPDAVFHKLPDTPPTSGTGNDGVPYETVVIDGSEDDEVEWWMRDGNGGFGTSTPGGGGGEVGGGGAGGGNQQPSVTSSRERDYKTSSMHGVDGTFTSVVFWTKFSDNRGPKDISIYPTWSVKGGTVTAPKGTERGSEQTTRYIDCSWIFTANGNAFSKGASHEWTVKNASASANAIGFN